jgi:hypothetical protein
MRVELLRTSNWRFCCVEFFAGTQHPVPCESIHTVAIPIWFKQGINNWMTAAGIGRTADCCDRFEEWEGQPLHTERLVGWSVVEQSAKRIGIEHFGTRDLCRHLRQTMLEEWRGSGANQIPVKQAG